LLKIKKGIVSCIGLILINISISLIYSPIFHLINPVIIIIIQLGFVWCIVIMWLSLKYILVDLHKLSTLKKNINWIIYLLSIAGGATIANSLFPYILSGVIFIILLVTAVAYIVLGVKLLRLDSSDFKNIIYLYVYILSIIVVGVTDFILRLLNTLIWNINIEFISNLLAAIPFVFILLFLRKELLDLVKKQDDIKLEIKQKKHF